MNATDILFSGRALSLAPLAMLSFACAAPLGYREGLPCEVVFRDYRSNLSLALRNESRTSRAELYDAPAESAPTIKIVSDATMGALLARLDSQGFSGRAAPGRLPALGTPNLYYGIGVEVEGSARSMLRAKGADPDLAEAMLQMQQSFREFYDEAFQSQRIQERGAEFFRKQQRKLEEEKKQSGGAP